MLNFSTGNPAAGSVNSHESTRQSTYLTCGRLVMAR